MCLLVVKNVVEMIDDDIGLLVELMGNNDELLKFNWFWHWLLIWSKYCNGKHWHFNGDPIQNPFLHESTCEHGSFIPNRVSQLFVSLSKYFPAEHLHLYGSGPTQVVPCVKYWHSFFVDEFDHIWP